MEHIIKNFDGLATNDLRKNALLIAEAGLEAIKTDKVIKDNVSLNEKILNIAGVDYDLNKYKSVKIIGFGKASCKAAYELDQILGNTISGGAVIGITEDICQNINTYKGTHPIVTAHNVELTGKIIDLVKNVTTEDLIIVLVSGGGSALLCWPMSECDQGSKLYEAFLKTGGDIEELNLVRKHISEVKGGGLTKFLYPATVVSLVLSDVPGNHMADIASGPTFKDSSTIEDAKKIIDKYNLGEYNLIETPKEEKYFENVRNIIIVSNNDALNAMSKKAEELGFKSKIITSEMYDETNEVVNIFENEANRGSVIMAGGEPKLIVTKKGGTGGRCQYTAMQMIEKIKPNQVFMAVASDGLDNGKFAGAIIDSDSMKKSNELGLKLDEALNNFDTEPFFESMGDYLLTGATESNVSDLLFIVSEK